MEEDDLNLSDLVSRGADDGNHSLIGRNAKSIAFRDELRRNNYVTPTSYLELISVFKFLLNEKRVEVGGLQIETSERFGAPRACREGHCAVADRFD